MNFDTLFNPIYILWLIIITGFVVAQIWNIVRSFQVGKIYDFGRKPLWGVDKVGKFHSIMQQDKKEDPTAFKFARIYAFFFLALSGLVWLLSVAVVII
ncbi:MAG: hypothetical protein NTY48_04865 [Candidatus Diapherotrites archaeon]|nr:hypothetical protein [Candidatus Diapherotrites archaeon]